VYTEDGLDFVSREGAHSKHGGYKDNDLISVAIATAEI